MHGSWKPGVVDRAEWRWAWGWALAVAALTCLPYLYAYFAAPAGQTFGGFLVNPIDGNSYLAKLRQGYEGEWLFRLPYTPEDQRGVFVFTLYLGLGQLARLTGLPLVLVFHLARLAGGVFLLLSVYRLAAELMPDRAARRWALAVAAFGSGLALVSLLLGRDDGAAFVPVDLYVPEAIGFYSILTNPHFSLAFALQAWAIIWVLNPPAWNKWVQLALGLLIGWGIAAVIPYLAPVVWVTVGAGVWATTRVGAPAGLAIAPPGMGEIKEIQERVAPTFRRAALVRGGILFGVMGLFLLYVVWALRSDPAVAEWARQNVTLSPPPLDVLLGLGVWLPLAALGAWQVYKERGLTPVLAALVVWLLIIAGLIYFPYPLQRRFLGGVFVPLAALAGVGAQWLLFQISRGRVAALAGILLFGFSTNLFLLLALFNAPRSANPTVYLTNDEAAMLRWLNAQATPQDVVLADPRLALFVPGWTGARTVYGHPMETIAAAVKKAEVETFYAGGDSALLDRYSVDYIIGGAAPAGWRTMFQSGAIQVYGR